MDAATLWNTPDPPSFQDSADDAGQLGNPLLHFSKTKGTIHVGCSEFFVRISCKNEEPESVDLARRDTARQGRVNAGKLVNK